MKGHTYHRLMVVCHVLLDAEVVLQQQHAQLATKKVMCLVVEWSVFLSVVMVRLSMVWRNVMMVMLFLEMAVIANAKDNLVGSVEVNHPPVPGLLENCPVGMVIWMRMNSVMMGISIMEMVVQVSALLRMVGSVPMVGIVCLCRWRCLIRTSSW